MGLTMAARKFSEAALLKLGPSRVKDQFARATTLDPQEFYLPFPPSVNGSTFNLKPENGGGRALTDRAAQWVIDAGKELTRQKPKAYTVPVEIWIYLEERSGSDCSNFFKKVEDLLVAHRIIADDNSKFVRSTHQVWSPETKGCRVSIRPAALHGGEA